MASDTRRLRVGIIGGGLAGAGVANALIQSPHLDVHVFESAPEFSERGAAIGLSANAQLALKEITPSAEDLMKKAGGVPMNSSRIMVGSGEQAGTLILDLAGTGMDPGIIFRRASLLRELLAPLPQDVLHPNKRLDAITPQDDGSVAVSFADGTVHTFDAVIGADGIFSSVRSHVLGKQAAKHAATPGGFWDARALVSLDKAKATLGEDLFELDRQYGWAGDGAFIMHDVLEDRSLVQVLVSAVEHDHPKDRKRALTKDVLDAKFKNWPDIPVAKGVKELLLDEAEPVAWSQWEHKSTPTYANHHVCIVGDAAHATTPWQGAGAGQALEDAMILGALFSQVRSASDVAVAFKAFDAVRRPRAQQVIDSSRGTGAIMCGQDKELGLDATKLVGGLAPRWGFIFALSMADHKEQALAQLHEFQKRNGAS
ncbi:salicylate hydroxylase [Emericellopsis atlantica]|uniref:Salicylate hydroxylase n=1 Tax=Emericellopsis atlantica TaxID=2614577 RepID=A0A9P7ZPZ2_9HYPO|nr:salicylate hydroxylase [Emericellopsis atlantica]KAG9255696.1 salicylate hydroxylase [Emericellopsis atlantica]